MRRLSGVALVAVADLEPLMAEQLAARYGIARYYADVDVMLERERPDVVHIATPPQSHLPLAIRALDAGCHLFVEKPLAIDAVDAEKLVGAVVRADRKLTIGYGYCFDPIARAMREMVANGVLGDAVHVDSVFGYALTGPFGASVFADSGHWVHQLPGKLVHNVIDHLLNKVTEFVSEQATVRAHAWQSATDCHPSCRMPDELRIMLIDQGVSAFATFTSHARPIAHVLTVYGTRNTAHLDFEAGTITLSSTSTLPGPLGRLGCGFGQALQYLRQGGRNVMRLARADYHALAGLTYLIAAFYDSIRRDTPVPIAYRDMLKVAAMTDAVFAQVRDDRTRVA